jgi:hypothetical protein
VEEAARDYASSILMIAELVLINQAVDAGLAPAPERVGTL